MNYEPADDVPEKVLRKVVTWDFVQAMQKEPEFAECSGVDWFVALWRLWRAEEHGGEKELGENIQEGERLGTDISGSLVLDALSKLLSATPDVLAIPLLPRIRNFIEGVDEDLTTLKYARFSCNLGFD